jgi:hypothetical protein
MDHKATLLQTVPTMNGWCDPRKANHVFDTVYQHDAKVCVELGVFAGRSLIAFGLAQAKRAEDPRTYPYYLRSRHMGSAIGYEETTIRRTPSGGQVLTTRQSKAECMRVSADLKISKHVSLLHMSTVNAYPQIKDPIDMLHIDGNHSRWDSVRDVTLWVDRVRPGGIIYFDDEDWNTTGNAQELLLLKCDKLTELKTSNVCGVYQKHVGGSL